MTTDGGVCPEIGRDVLFVRCLARGSQELSAFNPPLSAQWCEILERAVEDRLPQRHLTSPQAGIACEGGMYTAEIEAPVFHVCVSSQMMYDTCWDCLN